MVAIHIIILSLAYMQPNEWKIILGEREEIHFAFKSELAPVKAGKITFSKF